MRYGTYWVPKRGIFDDEELDSGYPDEAAARRNAEQLAALGYDVIVRERETIECDMPIESPAYREADAFAAKRWCVVVVKSNAAT